jgi:hypothetical protein
MNISAEKIAPPVAFVIVGFTMIIIAAIGGIPVGSPQLTITEPVFKTILLVIGISLVTIGPVLVWRELSTTKSAQANATQQTAQGASKNDKRRISIIEPREWKNGKPKRKKNSAYTLSPIRGIVTGTFGSVYLTYRSMPAGDLRISHKLTVKEDGAWQGSVKISDWDNNEKYEIVAIGYIQDIDLSHGVRINITPEIYMSNAVPVRIYYER